MESLSRFQLKPREILELWLPVDSELLYCDEEFVLHVKVGANINREKCRFLLWNLEWAMPDEPIFNSIPINDEWNVLVSRQIDQW